jgi:hypothetical protein
MPTYAVTTHATSDGRRCQAVVVEREAGREVHRTAWLDSEAAALDAAYAWLEAERRRQVVKTFRQAQGGAPSAHEMPRAT